MDLGCSVFDKCSVGGGNVDLLNQENHVNNHSLL